MAKNANCIVVGGPIAVGKSLLVDNLPFVGVQELYYDDKFQDILLSKIYQGDKLAGELLQFDMMLFRFERYKSLANQAKLHVFDRSIFEDDLFARFFLKNKATKTFYKSIWKDKINFTINKIGKPKLYIYLDCSWSVFKRRLFERNRLIETENFAINEQYFKKLLKSYRGYMMNIFKKYKLNYFIVNTNHKSAEKVREVVMHELHKRGIGDEIS